MSDSRKNGALEVVTTSNMKTSLLRSFVVIVALTASAFAAESFRSFTLEVAPGSSRETVRKKLGAPSAILGTDAWVYLNFTTSNPNAANPAYDTLVVAFTDGRVSAVKITDGRVVRQLLALQKAQLEATAAVAGK